MTVVTAIATGMDGPFWEVDLRTLQVTQLYDLVKELKIPSDQGEQPHFKATHAIAGKVRGFFGCCSF